MIVSCPACGTLYRHAAGSSGSRARCFGCDAAVQVAARRQYAVQSIAYAEAVAAPGGFMGSSRGSTTTVDSPGGARRAGSPGMSARSASVDDAELSHSGSVDGASTAIAADKAVAKSGKSSPVRALVAAILGAAGGGAAGFAGASQLGGPVPWWCGGGALLGVVAVLGVRGAWTSRKD